MTPPATAKIIEIFGEGTTDIGKPSEPAEPKTGVVSILVHTLCGKPPQMRVKRRQVAFLQGKRWWQKVRFAKQQAYYNKSSGVVFVLDTEGNLKRRMAELAQGRDAVMPDYPMAIGCPHPCIETWILADPKAIAKALGLRRQPDIPIEPENLPAPQQDRRHNPKTVLASCAGATRSDLSAADKDGIALAMNDMELVCQRCPLGFTPFYAEVLRLIRPLFE